MDGATVAGGVGATLVVTILVLLLIGALSGLLVGALARWALPGPDPMGWGRTILYGIGGSFIGGIISRALNVSQLLGFAISVACAAGLIWMFTRRNKSPSV